jgi:LPXTG-site transpeptidase (sortase) family protein
VLLKEKVGRPGRPSWWAAASLIVQLALTGFISVVLVACVLLAALWQREGSPNPFIYLLKADRKPKALLSASEHRGEESRPTLLSAAPSGVEDSFPPSSEAQLSDTEMAISTPEAAAGVGSPSLQQPFDGAQGGAQDSALAEGLAISQGSRGLLASLPDRPATRIVIPAIGVDALVVVVPVRNGVWDVEQITHEVGHLQGTASPGDSSNVVMAGHVTLSAGGYGPFRGLAQLQSGDEVWVYVGDGESYVYEVDSVKTVEPTDVEVAYPTTESILTLITCVDWDSGRGRYNNRLVVVAYLGG